jgi:CelD/BcsL family acetyltransferase involved in cellulose biosynthesis
VQPDVTMALAVGEATSLRELEALRPEWCRLWERCAGATPFQRPEWLLSWWRHFGDGELCVVTLRSRGQLVGLAPLFLYSGAGPGASRQVLLLGTGLSDYLGPLLAPEAGADAVALILDRLADHARRWDTCDFQQVPDGSPLLAVTPRAGWHDEVAVQDACPVLALPDAIEELGGAVPHGQMQALRYGRRRAERSGPLRVRRATVDDFDELFDGFLRLHRARWTQAGCPGGVLGDETVGRFHREAARGLLGAGLLRLDALYIGAELAACYYGFLAGARAYYYLAGFAPELAALSPGTLVVGHAIEEAVRERAWEFDFLRGREAYKYRWGAADRLNYRRCLQTDTGVAQ